MNPEYKRCTFDQSKELKKLGVLRAAEYKWFEHIDGFMPPILSSENLNDTGLTKTIYNEYLAYDASELMEIIPEAIRGTRGCYNLNMEKDNYLYWVVYDAVPGTESTLIDFDAFTSFAHALAQAVIWVKENNHKLDFEK